MITLLATSSLISTGILVALIHLLIVLLVVAVIYFIIIWIMGQIGAPPIAIKIVQIIFGLVAIILVINFLLGIL